jgi:hypothetical protein
MYFKVLELCMNFYLKHEFFLMYFKIPYDFTIRFMIRVCFAFSVRVKIAILTTLRFFMNGLCLGDLHVVCVWVTCMWSMFRWPAFDMWLGDLYFMSGGR